MYFGGFSSEMGPKKEVKIWSKWLKSPIFAIFGQKCPISVLPRVSGGPQMYYYTSWGHQTAWERLKNVIFGQKQRK